MEQLDHQNTLVLDYMNLYDQEGSFLVDLILVNQFIKNFIIPNSHKYYQKIFLF